MSPIQCTSKKIWALSYKEINSVFSNTTVTKKNNGFSSLVTLENVEEFYWCHKRIHTKYLKKTCKPPCLP